MVVERAREFPYCTTVVNLVPFSGGEKMAVYANFMKASARETEHY
jgi:hypothetical protein